MRRRSPVPMSHQSLGISRCQRGARSRAHDSAQPAGALSSKLRRPSKAQFNGYRRLADPHQNRVGSLTGTIRNGLSLLPAHAEAVSFGQRKNPPDGDQRAGLAKRTIRRPWRGRRKRAYHQIRGEPSPGLKFNVWCRSKHAEVNGGGGSPTYIRIVPGRPRHSPKTASALPPR
jgi:hypothetical protein